MHRFIHFLWITSVFRKHCSHKHLRVLHTKTFFPQNLSTSMWISALFMLYFLVGRWITWIYSSFRPNFSPRAWIPPTYSSFRIQSPSQPPVTNNYRPQIQNTPHDCSQEPPYGVFDIAVYSVYSAEVCPSVRVTVVDCSVPSR